MLGKLFKHEFKNTGKVILTLYAVTAVVTILYSITLYVQQGQNSPNLLSVSMLILYVLTLIALYVVTAIYSCWHFYKTTYSDQGYLTHTLPVKPLALLNSKLATALFWMTASFLLMLASLFFVLNAASGGTLISELMNADWGTFLLEWKEFGNMMFGEFIGYIFMGVILGNLHFLLMVYAAAAVGQLFSTNKLAFSILSGIVFYFIERVFNTILLVTAGSRILGLAVTETIEADAPPLNGMMPFFNTALLATLAFCIIYYAVNAVIIRKHVNLD